MRLRFGTIGRRLAFAALLLLAGSPLLPPGPRKFCRPILLGVVSFEVGYSLARLGKGSPGGDRWVTGSGKHPMKRLVDEGRWLDAPIAEVDKTTTGLLLANRWRRDPSLRLIAEQRGGESTPGPHGGLWDRDLDG